MPDEALKIVARRGQARSRRGLSLPGVKVWANSVHVQVFGRRHDETLPRTVAAGVRKAPRHEVAGSLALAVQRALWGFDGGAEFEGGCDTDRIRPVDLHSGGIGSV